MSDHGHIVRILSGPQLQEGCFIFEYYKIFQDILPSYT